MKRVLSVLICVGILGGMCACSKETTITKSSEEVTTTTSVDDTKQTMDSDALNAIGDIDVDEGLLTVTITMPADLIGEISQEEIDKMVEENGYISATLNDDGSLSCTMTKEMLEETAESYDKSFQESLDSGNYPNIISITHNDDFTDFTIEYSADEGSLADSFFVLSLYAAGGFYGIIAGNVPENVHVSYVNSETGDIIQEANSNNMAGD